MGTNKSRLNIFVKKWIRIYYMNIFTLILFLYERAAKAQTRIQGTEVIKGSYQILS